MIAALAGLKSETLDLLVIGGGIVGSGVVRDAAMRGLRAGLVDRYDFASGTSGRSSRLLHGGLRYLAQGRVGLVHQASVEKVILRRIAPHLSQPLAFVLPTYRGTDWPLWRLRVGVKCYDLLCEGKNFGRSSGLSRREALHRVPALKTDRLTGAVRYFDSLTNDARLVLDTLRSAAHHGAHLGNYLRFLDARRDGGTWVCEIEDCATAARFVARARTIVNATGPWAQRIPHSGVRLRLSKGIHVVIDRRRLPVTEAVVVTQNARLLFVLPWGDRIIIGTTDTDFSGAPEQVSAGPEDVDEVLRTVNEFFPAVGLRATDVISTWAGLRPLIAEADGASADISRAHRIRSPEPAWWDVAGGKLTTYRLMAEQTVDRVVRHLAVKADRCRTASEPLVPAAQAAPYSGILPPPCTREAVEHYVANEWAVHLDDVMLRRSGWHYYHADAPRIAEQVACWMAEIAGWSPARRSEELAAYRAGT